MNNTEEIKRQRAVMAQFKGSNAYNIIKDIINDMRNNATTELQNRTFFTLEEVVSRQSVIKVCNTLEGRIDDLANKGLREEQ